MIMTHRFAKRILINSDPATIWKTLTKPELMKQWMGEPEMGIEIQTDWKVNNPIIISGYHHIKFENKGAVLQYDLNRTLKYSHLSSISHLEDKPDNYSIIEFEITPFEGQTMLALTISNFPTEIICKHLSFYWRTTVEKIKILVEKSKVES
jgi:uncharacterized protein YndB with AHSA1/START domain